ncbi:coiled-coil domain-containing protein [Ceratobasidium sp. AG-Ba]|nr:coiled-coil domain-containing protein [Ceratobasidium sp. AG-Ba]
MFGPTIGLPSTTLCTKCGHQAIYHKHVYLIHVQRRGQVDPDTDRSYKQATSKEGRTRALEQITTQHINAITRTLETKQSEILQLIGQFNALAFSKNFAGHINATMDMLNLHLEELKTKPNTESERQDIKQAIDKLQAKLDLLNGKHK